MLYERQFAGHRIALIENTSAPTRPPARALIVKHTLIKLIQNGGGNAFTEASEPDVCVTEGNVSIPAFISTTKRKSPHADLCASAEI
jgi:hypothetical protein